MARYTAYCDASAWRGEGGAGVVLFTPQSVSRHALYLGEGYTNQRAELTAALRALHALCQTFGAGLDVQIVSDSAYLINGMTEEWYRRWEENGWKATGGKPVVNRLEWETLRDYNEVNDIVWTHMRGHDRGNESPTMRRHNRVADNLASAARLERRSWERLKGRAGWA